MKKRILYLDLPYHKKTKSSVFVLDLLKKYYDVDVYYYEPTLNIVREMHEILNIEYDFLVCWQVMPEDYVLSHINYNRGVFFPMYDNVVGMPEEIWERFRGFLIISFSRELYRYLLSKGFLAKYIQYFPMPPHREIENWGHMDSLFFWQRVNNIDADYILDMCAGLGLRKIYLHNAVDPGHEFKEITYSGGYDIVYSSWFKEKKDMLDVMGKAAYYAAPRMYEGIGMSFLEAMALGRCVIAPDYPTMNEYIVDGETGLLYHYDRPQLLSSFDVRKIQKNAFEYISEGYMRWTQDKNQIVEWMEDLSYYIVDKIEATTPKQNKNENKFKRYFELMNDWLMLKNRGVTLAEYFKDLKVKRIAVYGGGEVGKRLVEELEGMPVKVVGIIDRKPEQVKISLPVYGVYDKVEAADAIVVTPVVSFGEIYIQLARTYNCRVISLDEIISYFG